MGCGGQRLPRCWGGIRGFKAHVGRAQGCPMHIGSPELSLGQAGTEGCQPRWGWRVGFGDGSGDGTGWSFPSSCPCPFAQGGDRRVLPLHQPGEPAGGTALHDAQPLHGQGQAAGDGTLPQPPDPRQRDLPVHPCLPPLLQRECLRDGAGQSRQRGRSRSRLVWGAGKGLGSGWFP